MRYMILVCFTLTVSVMGIPAHASESELREAYTAYQAAAEEGDLRAALPHAQRAYELGLELYGPESRDTGLLAYDLGRTQNGLLAYGEAAKSLHIGISALQYSVDQNSPELFEPMLELGRAQLGLRDFAATRDTLEWALDIAERSIGPHSRQAGLAHYYLSYIPYFSNAMIFPPSTRTPRTLADSDSRAVRLNSVSRIPPRNQESHDNDDNGALSARNEQLAELIASMGGGHLVAAKYIFESQPEWSQESAMTALAVAAHAFRAGEDSNTDQIFQEAIDQLIAVEYADDLLLRLISDWVSRRHQRGWNRRSRERNLARVTQLAHLRREGEVVMLVRAFPAFPMSALNRGLTGHIVMEFTVTSDGHTDDIEVISTEQNSVFDRPSRIAIENFIYAPKMENGVPVDRPGVRTAFDFRVDNSRR